MIDLGTLGGSIMQQPQLTGPARLLAAHKTLAGNDHAFLYSGMMTDLGTLGGATSSAAGINNLDQIVGDSLNSDGSDHAFLYKNSTMYDLNQLLRRVRHWMDLNNAYAINDAGWIVGTGNNGGFLLTPVPEPSSMILLLIGGLVVGGATVSRRTRCRRLIAG